MRRARRSRARWARLGVRGKVLIGLLAASLATLATATAVVLPALRSRLDAERVGALHGLVRTARPSLRALRDRAVRPASPPLLDIIGDLQERTGGRVTLYDAHGLVLADTARVHRGPAVPQLALRMRQARERADGVHAGAAAGVAYAVAVTRAGRRRVFLVIAKRLDDTRAAEGVLRAALPTAAVVALLVAVALGAGMTRALLRRLTLLHADATALGTTGLSHPVTVSGEDEIADVAAALERMRRRLADEEASRQQFVATASHELRTPLASLQATLELLREDAADGHLDPARTVARTDAALRQTHRLVGLAGDLLDLSRVDAHVPLRREPVELRGLASAVAREFAERLASAGRDLVVDAATPVLAHADPLAVARIVRILVDNACGYGAGTVTVSATVVAEVGRAELAVADEGTGLADDEVERVFLRFARGTAAGERPGSGLGLAIARGLAAEMDGTVDAVPVARGARFVVRLPLWHGQ